MSCISMQNPSFWSPSKIFNAKLKDATWTVVSNAKCVPANWALDSSKMTQLGWGMSIKNKSTMWDIDQSELAEPDDTTSVDSSQYQMRSPSHSDYMQNNK